MGLGEGIDQGLLVEFTDDDRLCISVGLNILKHAVEHSPEMCDEFSDGRLTWSGDDLSLIKDIIYELEREDHDGTTPIHRLLDKAVYAALENGTLGLDFEDF